MVKGNDGKSMTLQQAYALAVQAHQQGDAVRAENICRQLLVTAPEAPDVLYLLGALVLQRQSFDEAVTLLSKAVANAPQGGGEAARYYLSLGLAHERRGDYHAALDAYQQAIKRDASLVEAHNNSGNVLYKEGRISEAETFYREAIRLMPSFSGAHLHLGHLLKIQGDKFAAQACYREALRWEPDNADIYRSLCGVKKFTDLEDADLVAMERHVGSAHCSDESRMYLHFSLGKAYEDLQQYEQAFSQWQQANRLKRQSFHYDINDEASIFERIKRVFNPAFIDRHEGLGVRGASPVFIVGMPRSGSTLTEQILASHSQVFGGGELPALKGCISAQGVFPDAFELLDKQLVDDIGQAYLAEVARLNNASEPIMTDKMLFNFFYIGLIRIIFPEAKIVHCFRNPMASCLSMYQRYFPELNRFYYDLVELGRFYLLYQDLMAYWHRLLPGFIHDVEYERLVAEPELEARALLSFCGLSWESQCLEFHKQDRVIKTASASQVRQPLYKHGISRWQNYASFLEPLKEALEFKAD